MVVELETFLLNKSNDIVDVYSIYEIELINWLVTTYLIT